MLDLASTRRLAAQLRVDAVCLVAHAGSGHPTSSLSAADLMAVLLAKHLRYDFDQAEHPGNDHLIFSDGHASPLLYAMYRAAGAAAAGCDPGRRPPIAGRACVHAPRPREGARRPTTAARAEGLTRRHPAA